MSSQRTKRFVEDKTPSKGEVHFVPFKVEFDGESSSVGPLFTNQATPHPDLPNVYSNYFRGRPLQGTQSELPSNYVAVVGEEVNCGRRNIQKEDDDKIKIRPGFQKLTYWEWDKPPSSMDSILKLQDWLSLSTVIHEPIEVKK